MKREAIEGGGELHVKEKIGFIGTGIMGEPMATNLVNTGYPLYVYDIRLKQ